MPIMKIFLFIILSFGISFYTHSQENTEDKKLPVEIDESKKIPDKDLSQKVEGWFPTGLPFVFTDPNNGFGYGGRLYLINNGQKKDSLFEYTPYRQRMFVQYSNTTKNAQYHILDIDAPYIFDTRFRLRTGFVYERNPNNLYFGVGERTLNGLAYKERNDPRGQKHWDSSFTDHQENLAYRRPPRESEGIFIEDRNLNTYLTNQRPELLRPNAVTDKKYNRFEIEQPAFNFSLESSFFGGIMRLVGGTKLSQARIFRYDGQIFNAKDPFYGETKLSLINVDVPTVNGKTKLTEDHENKKIRGYDGGYVNLLRFGFVIDTRDFEPDPNKGVFLELTHERSMKGIGSDYEYNKTFGSVRFYYSPFPKTFDKLVFAGRAALVNTRGDVPFFEYRNMWGTEGIITGLGGRTTLRGYMQDRFVGPTMGFGNIELRWKFLEIPGFAFNLVPFFDFGRVWDKIERVNLQDYQYSYGTGLRIAWNQSTIIYLDFAKSKENSNQIYLNFNHIF